MMNGNSSLEYAIKDFCKEKNLEVKVTMEKKVIFSVGNNYLK